MPDTPQPLSKEREAKIRAIPDKLPTEIDLLAALDRERADNEGEKERHKSVCDSIRGERHAWFCESQLANGKCNCGMQLATERQAHEATRADNAVLLQCLRDEAIDDLGCCMLCDCDSKDTHFSDCMLFKEHPGESLLDELAAKDAVIAELRERCRRWERLCSGLDFPNVGTGVTLC